MHLGVPLQKIIPFDFPGPGEIDFSQVHHIDFFGVPLYEPSTILSSLVMTFVCWIAYRQLAAVSTPHPVYRFARLYLLFMGLATAIGGILGHGFLYLTGLPGKLPGWICSLLAIAFYERAVLWHATPLLSEKVAGKFRTANVIALLVFLATTLITLHFMVIQVQAFYSLFVVVGGMELWIYRKTGDPGSILVFKALAWAILAAGVHASGISLGVWFTTNDISHIPMSLAIWYFHKGILSMRLSPATYKNGKP